MITDFGLSQVYEGDSDTPLMTACGTPGYVGEFLLYEVMIFYRLLSFVLFFFFIAYYTFFCQT